MQKLTIEILCKRKIRNYLKKSKNKQTNILKIKQNAYFIVLDEVSQNDSSALVSLVHNRYGTFIYKSTKVKSLKMRKKTKQRLIRRSKKF